MKQMMIIKTCYKKIGFIEKQDDGIWFIINDNTPSSAISFYKKDEILKCANYYVDVRGFKPKETKSIYKERQ